MPKLSKKNKHELEKACVVTLMGKPPSNLRSLDEKWFDELRNFYDLVAQRWAKLIEPEIILCREINDDFYEQYIDREARWFRALFELIIATEGTLKRESRKREVSYPFCSPREFFDYLTSVDAFKKMTTSESLTNGYEISRLLIEIANGKKCKIRLSQIQDRSEHLPDPWWVMLFQVASRKRARGIIKDRWQDFMLASYRVVESINIYCSNQLHKKQVKTNF